jgi:chromosome segregation ATPase
MPVTAPAPLPLAIDRVERSRAKRDQVRLRLSGRWLGGEGGSGSVGSAPEAMLVVQIHGRRHRFAATGEDEAETGSQVPLTFTASFTVPDWAVPEQPGQAVLWVGDEVVPVPPPGTTPRAPAAPQGPEERVDRDRDPGPGVREPGPGHAGDPGLAEEGPAGRSGPLSDLLFKETVTALRAELEQRTAEAARLRSSLLQARQQPETRGPDPGLESAHAELREELRRLMDAVGDQLDPVRGELDEARSELADVRAELEGVRAELEQARADRDGARGELDGRLATARAEFDQQLAAARAEGEAAIAAARREAEAETELARQETETMLAAARGDADARTGAAQAEARDLAARLREHAAGERRRAEEAAVLREQLAAAHVARDAALAEAGGLRAELERLGAEVAVLREQTGHAGDELSQARQLLADARALTERLRGESSP